jgi:hypothetical protein
MRSFPFVCSLQELLITVVLDEFKLLLVLPIFPSPFAPEIAKDLTRTIRTIGAALQTFFSKSADFDLAFGLAQVPLAVFMP